jgi:hypothetical protein
MAEAHLFVSSPAPLGPAAACLAVAPELREDIAAMRVLSGVGYGVIHAYLIDSTASGSLMRRKLAPVLDALQAQIDRLRRGHARR